MQRKRGTVSRATTRAKSPTLVGNVVRRARLKQAVDFDAASAIIVGERLKRIDSDVLPCVLSQRAQIRECCTFDRIVLRKVERYTVVLINEAGVNAGLCATDFATKRVFGHELGELCGEYV